MRPEKHPKKSKNFILTLGFVILLLPAEVLAAEEDEEGEKEPEVVEIISSKVPVLQGESGSSVTVLTKDEIEKSQKVSVFDLLRGTPGVQLSRNGGIGTVSTLRIRGAESGQTLVLIDGVKVNDLSSPGGEFNFANLTTENIEKIEILRGPQSTLYGSDAIGGVINIITKKGGDGVSASAFFEGGSFATFRGGADFGLRGEKTSFNVSIGGERTSGISAADENAGNAEGDGFRTISVIANFSHELAKTFTVNGFVRHADSRAEFDTFDFGAFTFVDGDGVTETEDRQVSAGFVWTWLKGKGKTDAKISFARTRRMDEEFQAPSFASDSRNRIIDLLNTFEVSDEITLVIGGQHQDTEIRTESFGAFASVEQGSADIASVFSEVVVRPVTPLRLTFGVRHDDHETFGGHTTFRVTGNYKIEKTGTTLRGAWGEGFKAPTLFQLFSSFGDPALQPETSTGWEVGLDQNLLQGRVNVGATYFRRKSRNLIDFSLLTFTFANILETRAKGVEITFNAKISEAVVVSGNFTHLNAVNTATGLALVRRPADTFNLQIEIKASRRLSLTAALNHTGSQIDAGVRLQPFTTVDFRFQFSVTEAVSLFGRVENALDEQYQEVAGFGTPGVSAFGGVRGTF